MPKSTLPADILQAALIGYQAEKAKIDAKIAELKAQLASAAEKPGRKLSPEGRQPIIAATKRRWATARRVARPIVVSKKSKKVGTSGTGPRVSKEAEAE